MDPWSLIIVKCSSERFGSWKDVTFVQEDLFSLSYIFVALEVADCLQLFFFLPSKTLQRTKA